MRFILVAAVVCLAAVVSAAPADLDNRLRSLQEQLSDVQRQLKAESAAMVPQTNLNAETFLTPQKRMAAWQPMKRSLDERAPLIRAIEARLSEILRAGEKLGVTADEVLSDLRLRNSMGAQ